MHLKVYGAMAYGARGLYYYCWGHGIVEWPSGKPGPNYPTVVTANADAAKWGKMLIQQR